MLHSLSDVLCLFPSFPLKGVCFFCILVASYGHVSLIVDQLDWQCCRSPCGTVVEWSWDHWWVVAKPENRHRAYVHLIGSHRHRSIHTRVVHQVGQRRQDGWTSTRKASRRATAETTPELSTEKCELVLHLSTLAPVNECDAPAPSSIDAQGPKGLFAGSIDNEDLSLESTEDLDDDTNETESARLPHDLGHNATSARKHCIVEPKPCQS